MSQTQTARLKLGDGAIVWTRREIRRGILQRRLRAQHRQYLLGVFFPIGCHVQIAAGLEFAREQRHERRLNQTAFVMALFRPRIGEKNMRAVKCLGRDHVVEHFNCVVLHDADIANRRLANGFQQSTDARCVHFNGEVIAIGMGQRDMRRRLAHAETNL